MKLTVIIVNYNVRYFLEQALLSVRRAAQGLEIEVYVVDNNSVDTSVQMVREKFPEIHLMANTDNPGFSIANNQAIRASQGEYVLLLNPDTVVEEDTFSKVIQFMDAHPQAGGLGVKMIDGSGNFLPESKRGFPSPFVAFAKIFGLSKIFPKSKTFGRYHLGFLDKDETHEVDVLSGAFMLLRRTVLDKIGLLDETFFMYGEDIDLSYRIVKAGYENYYFADTTIIHYKGESTKKGSLNYVRAFYNAMIIFAKKHFKGEQARLFVLMLQAAIYFRAAITIGSNFIKNLYLPILDTTLIYSGLYFLKNFWANYYFKDPNYYDETYMLFNAPLAIVVWLTSMYFSGGYDERGNLRKITRGLTFGTVILAAIYGFLPLHLRSSRALIVLGFLWAIFSTISLRTILHFFRFGNFNVGRESTRNLVIIGSTTESERVTNLLHKAQVHQNIIGTVTPEDLANKQDYLGSINQLSEIVHIYKIDEIIFCSQDVTAQQIMRWMTELGADLDYKIVPAESLSIIGSSSKNTSGQLYTIDIQFNIAKAENRRNKRVFDVLLSLISLLISPLLLLFGKWQILKNIFPILIGKRTWVGYKNLEKENQDRVLPKLRSGVFNPTTALKTSELDAATIQRLNFFYAKDYGVGKDWEVVWAGVIR